MKIRILLTTLCLSFTFSAQAQESKTVKKDKKFYLELRPIQFLLNGYSLVGHYKTGARSQLGINVFAATLTDGITDFVWNTDPGLDIEAQQDIVIAVSYRYFPGKKSEQQGFFLGMSVGLENYSLTERSLSEEQGYNFWYLAPRVGYLWHPFRKAQSAAADLFVALEAVGVLPLFKSDPALFSAGGSAEINNFLPSPLIGIGFRF